jgi:glycosyltransferase involved in cell wall biosynthesis
VTAVPPSPPSSPVAAVIPCKDEADRIAATVRAVRAIPGVDLVVVVDDGSTDETSARAHDAGAHVVRHARNAGKAAALVTGVRFVRDREGGGPRHHYLFVDGDLQESAEQVGVLVPDVLSGAADMTIATLPPQKSAGGGRGFVVRLARDGIRELTGWEARQPLSGMRCLTAAAYDAASPLAPGWGVEVGLTVDVLRAGLRVIEVPCELHHRVTGADWRGQVHRAKQYRDVLRALRARGLRAGTVGRAARGR